MAALPRGRMFDLLLKAQPDFKTAASGDYARSYAYSAALGETFGMPDDPLLGAFAQNERDVTAPAPDVHRWAGRLQVPLDRNHIGHWLKLALGAPISTPIAASGSILFSGNPANNSTITINGTVFTFVPGTPGAGEIQIGGTLADTLSNIVTALNGSSDPDVAAATYGSTGGTTLTIAHDTAGPAGNAFTLAASGNSNGAVSAATLFGGHHRHVFVSGADELPIFSLEERLRTTAAGGPKYRRHIGAMLNTITMRMNFTEGYHRADLELVGRNEEPATGASQGGTPTALDLAQVPAVKGLFRIEDVGVVPLLSAEVAYRNNLSPLEYVSDDEYVSGFEPGDGVLDGTIRLRYLDETHYDLARVSSPLDVEFEWRISASSGLTLACPALRLGKVTHEVGGPGGLEHSFPIRGEQVSGTPMLTATLRNLVAGY